MFGLNLLPSVIALVIGAVLTGFYSNTKVLKVKNELAEVKLKTANEQNQILDSQILKMEIAFTDYQNAVEENQNAYRDVLEGISLLRTDTVRLRNDFDRLPDKLATATQPVISEYATACTAVLTDLVESGNRLAQLGAEIAAKADGHAADVRLLR